MALGQLVVRLGLDAVDFTQGMSRSEAEAQRFAAKLASDITSAATAVAIGLGTIATAAVGAFKLINDQAETIAAFQQLSEKIGDTAENLASLKKASDVSGTSMDSIAAASVKLTSALSKTDEEGQGAAKAIKALGLDFDAFKKLSPVDQIEAVSKAMNGFEDGANKTAVAVALWGKSGADMIPLLNDLANGSERNVTLTQDQITAADVYSKKLAGLKSETQTYAQQLSVAAIPAMTEAINRLRDLGVFSVEAGGGISFMQSAIDLAGFALKNLINTGAYAIFTFQGVGKAIGAAAAAAVLLASGDLAGAKSVYSSYKSDVVGLNAALDSYLIKGTAANKLAAGNATATSPFKPSDNYGTGQKKPDLPFSGIKTPKAKAKAEKEGGTEKLSEADKYLANLQRQLEATEKLTVVEALQRDITLGRLGVLLPAQQESLVLTAQQIDQVKAKELAEKTAAAVSKEGWDLEKKSILENFKSYDEAEKAKAALGESLRLSVRTQTEELVALEATYKDAIDQKIISQETFERLMGKVRERYDALSPALLNFNDLAKTGAESLSSGLADAIVQGKSLADVFKNVVKQLAAMILKALIFKAIEIGLNAVGASFGVPGLGTATVGVAGKRAAGGPVGSGKTYLVGEKGPELFTPSASGKITTNAQTFKPQSGGGGLTNVYNISAPGVSREEFTAGLNRSQAGAVTDVRDNKLRRRA